MYTFFKDISRRDLIRRWLELVLKLLHHVL